MSRTTEKLLAIFGAILIILLGWFLGPWLDLDGALRWIIFGGLTLIAIAVVVVLWLMRWRSAGGLGPEGAAGQLGDAIDLLIREAETRLASSAKAPGKRVRDLPVVVLLGETGSAKTTTVLRSGLDPELLAGQAQNEGAVTPTKVANLWLGGHTVLADSGGAMVAGPEVRRHFIRRLMPRQRTIGSGEVAPRAAIVCFDTEALLRSGASESLSRTAGTLREMLGEMCRGWGVNVPVYVLFTRLDRVNHFLEYASALTQAEAGALLGSSLALDTGVSGAAYAEAAGNRLGDCFHSLIAALEDRRLELLGRVENSAQLTSAFQFPREFRKLRNLVVQFLIDIGRPSQLSTNPVLRGFYFTGVRPVIVADNAAAETRRASARSGMLTDATGVFRTPGGAAPEPAFQEPVSRKVPQWVFLAPLLPSVVLQDRAALGLSRASTKVSFRRRLMLSLATATAVLLGIAWTISYLNNRALEKEVTTAAEALGAVQTSEQVPVTTAALERLDAVLTQLRPCPPEASCEQRLASLEQHTPLSYRWGLYSGHRLYEATRRIYLTQFRHMLLQPAQKSLLGVIGKPETAGLNPNQVYDALKAYLITTSNPEKASESFLVPKLGEYWSKGRTVDAAMGNRPETHFRYYTQQLPNGNPFPGIAQDKDSVAAARAYLTKVITSETIYQTKLAQANEKFAAIRFNQKYPGTERSVVNNYKVDGAFTKEGWAMMQDGFKNPFQGEEWVIGKEASARLDPAKLQTDLQGFYARDFKKAWREFLTSTHVVAFKIRDAVPRLSALSNYDSPLLKAICLASVHTQAAGPDIAAVFQPVKQVEPQTGCLDKLSDPANEEYAKGLNKLNVAFQELSSNLGSDSARQKTAEAANSALVEVGNVAGKFQAPEENPPSPVKVGDEVRRLLKEPIDMAQAAIEGAAVEPVNGAGADLCGKFNSLLTKYPFSPKATEEAKVADLNRIFSPGDGELWKFYETTMAKFMPKPDFNRAVADNMTVTPGFQNWFKKAAAVTNTLYKAGSKDPQISFTVTPVASRNVQSMALTINGQTQRGASNSNWQFTWPGKDPQEVRMSVTLAGGSTLDGKSFTGLWGLSRFFGDPERLLKEGVTAGGIPVEVKFDPPSIFRPGYFGDLRCVGPAVQKAK